MQNRSLNSGQQQSGGKDWAASLALLAVGGIFFALWFWLLPPVLGFQVDTSGVARWHWIAVVPAILGFAVALRCMWDFGKTGHGTPAPFIPPRKLVVVGFYRYVRNPMDVGFFAGWTGLWVIFGRANVVAIEVAAAITGAVVLFVLLYEEPTLRKTFGADYLEYCKNVRRWLPSLSPWNK